MVIGTLIGMSLAYIRHTKEFRFASLIDACVWILLVSPSFIIAQGWVMFASPSGVALNTFGIDVSQLVFSTGGIIAVMALTSFPLSYLATSAALNWNTSSLWEAAASLGVSPWTVFWTLRLPLLAPAVISGALLVFVETLGDFGLPAAISSQYNFPTLPYSIYASVRQSPVNFALGGVLSLYLVIIVAIAIFIYLRILRSSSFSFLSGSSVQNTKRQSRISGLYSLISIVAFIVTLGIPIGSSLQVSLSERLADGFTISNLTLAHYEQALEMGSNLMNGIRNSVIIAVVVALLTTLLGLMMAISMTFTNFAGNKLLDLAGTVSLAVPGIVLAVGYIFVWNQPALNTINLDLYGTPVLLVFSGVAAAEVVNSVVYGGWVYRYGFIRSG
ncbi:ABC transporter permease [Auritidibacter ignavus]|uniref:ABC transporter permease n=1 Tax=Auritidibacter ignavus TaxID=678932 RepID=UPI00244D79E0|nr:ABC transporter permease subunit [Auritidibacter ignavus]WGH85157.1 ABC transporter permease subunit [Auritidibacter ignavus]WGH87445.1 ABC transporter permease subunit [Auritidibacter ignavus]